MTPVPAPFAALVALARGRDREALRAELESARARFNRREGVGADPLHAIYAYENIRDREIAGFLAAALAFGRVEHIRRSVAAVLAPLGPHPAAFLAEAGPRTPWGRIFADCRHRWAGPGLTAELVRALAAVVQRHGSLEAALATDPRADHVGPALARFADELAREAPEAARRGLIASPSGGSACKRMLLWLRWMVRHDEVDPGGWTAILPSHLLVPLDVHMFRLARACRFTRRRQPDFRAAVEVTRAFASVAPDDPVRYDYALTHGSLLRAAGRGGTTA